MASLRVGLVLYGLDRPLSGVTRYAEGLGGALPCQPDCEVVHLTTYRHGPFTGHGSRSWYLPGCSRLPLLMLLGGPALALAARVLRLDLIHDPTGVTPFTLGHWAGRFKRITTIHDAIAFRYPKGYPWLNNFLHRRFVPAVLPNVDACTTVSEHARKDLMHYLALPPSNIHVVPSAVGDEFRPLADTETADVLRSYDIKSPYVLSLGSQQERKNVRGILEAFVEVHRRAPQYSLVITGPTQWGHQSLTSVVDQLGLSAAVNVIGYVPSEHLPALYSGASAFVFPSLYEGFGLPPLEAMACGTPVVCSNTTSLPEVTGDAAIHVDPRDPNQLAEAILDALLNEHLRASLRERGLDRARHYTWRATASKSLAVYRKVLAA